ncbi:MAG: hypothetical protein GY782_12000 [Gammaproteobacteria bacterium]|nr:hypothetical protein [Gammaproteobacteria bacterium]
MITQCKERAAWGELTLITAAEPDVLSQSAIYWANVVHEANIKQVYFGAELTTIQQLWPFGIDIPAQEILDRASITR